ncbi:GNAT family N-acetyltransferase [Clostridium butyricum]|nr:GNAT family N-acetyltransferase [Clostridium butyricum]AXB86855.1 GNAT family N-acetyltransferase [Clostridium butyricum]
MNISELSLKYQIRKLDDKDIDLIYTLSIGNPKFYKYFPPYVTKESIHEDMNMLPPNKSKEDKFYIGFFDNNILVAVMDLIINFPDNKTAFIGLFMMEQEYQGKGIGSNIIEECATYLKALGFKYIRLAYANGNSQSEAFWLKNSFYKTGDEFEKEGYTAVLMQREL